MATGGAAKPDVFYLSFSFALRVARRWAAALLVFACAALSASPASAQTAMELFGQGFDAYAKQDYAAAEQAFKAGLEKGDAAPEYLGLAHYYLAQALLAQQQSSEDARAHYKDAARLIPQKQEGRDASAKLEQLGLIDECDRLAANVKDPDRPPNIPGVELRLMDGPAAVKACAAAAKAFPNQRRVLFQLGLAYQRVKNNPESLQWFERAAEAGSMRAMLNLAWSYEYGVGTAKDYALARQWYDKAGKAGDVEALFRIGMMIDEGRGVRANPAAARKWFEKAALEGDTEAMIFLGRLHENGKGVPVNYAEARRWYRKAADAGDRWGMSFLGDLYQSGKGVRRDFQQARHWYEKAAAGGERTAMIQLGDMYAQGLGVPRNPAYARKWYEQAAAAGHPMARKRLEALNHKPRRNAQ